MSPAATLPAASRTDSDGDLSVDDFRHIAAIIYKEAGIVLREQKMAMVRGRLVRRVRDRGLSTIPEYCKLLHGPMLAEELPHLLNAITTNHTAFFREEHHFAHLRQVALPALCPGGPSSMNRFRVWCAAASTGEEPYTIAGSMLAWLNGARPRDCLVLATDIDSEVLKRAEQGVYADSTIERLTPEQKGVLALSPAAPGEFRVGQQLSAMLRFRQLNILSDWPFSGPFQIIFCRNMLIYFDTPTKMAVVARLAEMLVPGGYLYLGHSEALASVIPSLRPVARTTYQRV